VVTASFAVDLNGLRAGLEVRFREAALGAENELGNEGLEVAIQGAEIVSTIDSGETGLRVEPGLRTELKTEELGQVWKE
jgi:hypothetical protein